MPKYVICNCITFVKIIILFLVILEEIKLYLLIVINKIVLQKDFLICKKESLNPTIKLMKKLTYKIVDKLSCYKFYHS